MSTAVPVSGRVAGGLFLLCAGWVLVLLGARATPHDDLRMTVSAFVAILFTARYPRSLFAAAVGILRWGWRVSFYAYSTLGTDQYPPFTLRDVDYPARLQIDYPERLARGLALVKWWLLAIPHYLILAVFTGAPGKNTVTLLPLLTIFAGAALLFTARYPRGMFDLNVGVHRWMMRVAAYACLMSDTYPPFRLDQGADRC